jgi:hypothetical protein
MRIAKALLVAIILVLITSSAIPAFAWSWPILGFNNTCFGYVPGYKPVPGTPGWTCYPDSGRGELVMPGSAYYPSACRLGFGFSPGSFGPAK